MNSLGRITDLLIGLVPVKVARILNKLALRFPESFQVEYWKFTPAATVVFKQNGDARRGRYSGVVIARGGGRGLS